MVTNTASAGERQLSLFGSWESDAAIIVLFDDQFRVWKTGKLLPAQFQAVARLVTRFNSYRVMATDALLEQGEDWTDRLREAEGRS